MEFKPRVKLAAGAGFCKPSVPTGGREVETKKSTDLCGPVSPTQTVTNKRPYSTGWKMRSQSLPSDPHTRASAGTQLHCHADACTPPHIPHTPQHTHAHKRFLFKSKAGVSACGRESGGRHPAPQISSLSEKEA